jgi:predicted transcriptional regulator
MNPKLRRQLRQGLLKGCLPSFNVFALSHIHQSEDMFETSVDTKGLNPLLTTKIVGGYFRRHTVMATELPDLITSVRRALTEIGLTTPPEVPSTPAVSVRQSVRHDYVVCLDCGYRGQTLRCRIASRHGLSPDEYLKRWRLRHDHPLTAPAYSERRSALAKQLGLGRKPKMDAASEPVTAISAAANSDAKVTASPKSRRATRSRSRSDVVSGAASEPKARQRKQRSRLAATQSEPPSTPTVEAKSRA